MTTVVDASVALKWVVPEPGSIAAAALRSSSGLVAPSNWIVEAANGLWKYVLRVSFRRRKRISAFGN